MATEITMKTTGEKALKAFYDPKKYRKVMRSTVNATATAVRKEFVDEASKIYNIKKSRIKKAGSRDNVKLRRARRNEDTATITYSKRQPGLGNFSPNKAKVNRKGGLKYKIEKKDSLKVLRRGFFANIKGGRTNEGFESRQAMQRVGITRYSINVKRGPSNKQMYEVPIMTKHIEKFADKTIPVKFSKAFDKVYGK